MANFSSDQKYLDKYGLSLFWDKVRQYIQNQIGEIDGTDVKLYPSGETNPTVTDQIEKLWNSIGSGELEGGISGSIEAILGQYVKDIQHADSQTTPLKVVVNEGTENEADFYTVTLEDNGLANTLSDLTTNRVSSLDPVNGGGSVTLAVDKNKGDVTLTINSQELTNKVSGLETTIDGMVKSVNKAENGDGTYVKLNIDPITGDVKLSINDQSLVSELTSIKDNYVKTEDLPTTLPNPHKFTLTYRDKKNQENVVVYDGSSAKDVDFSLYHATTSTTATRVSNSLKVVDANGTAYDYNGGIMVDLSGGINYAANSGKLGGQLPSYYGKQSDITTISQKIATLEALTHVNQIITGDGASDLVKIGFSTSTGDVVASIDETNLSNKLTSIDNYTINSKKISTNPVLTGSDITLGTTVGDNVNYPTTTTLTSSIQKLRETIAGLGQVVELKGVLSSLPTTTEGYENGDVVIVGNKEYICYNSTWYLLGDTTELSQDVSTIKSSYVKSIKATGTGVTVSPTTSSTGDVTINVDATPITNAISELEANFGNYYTKTQVNTELAKYLLLSGGTMSGPISGLTNLTSAGNITATEYGFRLSSTQYDGYIWNTVAGKGISIGLIDNGSASSQYASLNIKGSNIYPGTSNKFSLGTDSYKFKDIFADGVIKGSRFLYGTKTKAELESNTNSGLSIATQVPLNESTAGDYGFHAVDNANGVLAFRAYSGSGANYMHYLGFSQKGLFYRNNNATDDKWTKLNNPSILSISVPEIEYSSSPKILPEIINGNIINVFHDIPQTMILIERSQDGTTWTDTTETDYPKFKQVMSTGKNASPCPCVANDTVQGQVGDRVRITVNGSKAYSKLSHLYVYFSTEGATVKLSVEYNTKDDQNTWITLIDKQSCVGWSGPNYYGLNESLIGSPDAGKGYSYRITFEITAISENYNNIGSIYNLWMLSPTKPYSLTGNPTDMFYFDVKRWRNVTNKSIEPLINANALLGSQNYKWLSVYAENFYGTNFYGTAQKATMDASGRNIADTYALASTCYGGPEGKINGYGGDLIGKSRTGSWGIYNEHHDIIISEYDSSTETWVEKFNSASLTSGSANYNALAKGMIETFYTSTRGSKVKLSVNVKNGAAYYINGMSIYLKTKDSTYSNDVNYTYSANNNYVTYSDSFGTWGSWIDITIPQYRSSFDIILNEDEANAQIKINGFRIITNIATEVPVLVGKSHESYKADTATRSAMVGDGTIQLYAQSGNEINFGGTNTTNPSIIFGYKSADENQIVPTQYRFGKDAIASVYAAKFVTTGGTASQVVLGDGALKAISDFTDTKVTQTLASSNANYPILLAPTGQTTTTTTTSYFNSGISCNPSLNALNVDMINVKNSSIGGTIYFGDKNNDNDGFVYITEDESDKLCLAGDLGITFKTGFNNAGGDIVFDIWPYDEDRAAIRPYTSSTNVRAIDIGRDSARFTNAYFSGTVYAATSFMQSSDERLKDFGPELEVNLDELSKLRKSYFTFKDKPEDLQIGVSAQEIQKLYPEIVSETDDGYLNVDYSKLAVIALAAIDKLNEEIKELKKLINK